MYLSRVELNQFRRKTQQALASPHIMHGMVEASFPKSSDRQRTLWRLDSFRGALHLLLLSHDRPDLSHVVENCGWGDCDQEWVTRNYDGFLESLQTGQVWRFRLCANPVHSVGCGDNERGTVYAHVTVEQQMKWLYDRAGKNGFDISGGADIVARDVKEFKRGGARVTIGTAAFEGVLTVTDSVLFRNALVNGIGRAKAYGCGLLTLAVYK
ncbi:MAG: type I-E CRISPR-associated protein Cas6/Cse3/CasE [Armatimonadota bacterium]